MIEDITAFAIGICAGLVPFLIFEILNIYRKIKRINIEINKLQNENVRFKHDIDTIANSVNFNRECIEHIANKITRLNDNINDKFGFLD